MRLRIYKIISVLLAAALLFMQGISVSAAKLKIGSVKGLPEKLVVLDDKGNSVSENGEYFFEVEGMNAGETYSKTIQLMNLREDATYAIFFSAEGLESHGEIDLENECTCEIHLNNDLLYTGKVTGEGTPDMRQEALYLGYYRPGDSRVLTVDITWIDGGKGGEIDFGERVVDKNGTSVVRGESGKRHIEGEVTFKWIFTASVVEDEDSTISTISTISREDTSGSQSGGAGSPSVPEKRGGGNNVIDFVKTGDTVIYVAIGIVAVAMVFMMLLVAGKRRKDKDKKKKTRQ